MKKISKSDIIGRLGVSIVEQAVLRMGHHFYETGSVEAGIDGYIEFRDADSGEVSNIILQVQVKATERRLTAETAESFEYLCDEKDLHYWYLGNAPIILIVVKTDQSAAYWKSIKDYFADPEARKARRIVFDKKADLFGPEARDRLFDVATRSSPGAYMPPARRAEELIMNALAIERFAPTIFVADTEHKTEDAMFAALKGEVEWPAREWMVKSGRIFSFHDLDMPPWRNVCDRGSVEPLDSAEWAESEDPDMQRDFVRLMNRALRSKVGADLRFCKDRYVHYFRPYRNRIKRAYSYRSFTKQTSRIVVNGYGKRRDGTGFSYVRHAGFRGQFLRLGARWYLTIEPTYYFTRDGIEPDAFFGEHLSKIKQFENNAAVLGQFQMWQHYLTAGPDMFRKAYPFLSFRATDPLTIDVGVPDDLWRERETPEREALLFGEPE